KQLILLRLVHVIIGAIIFPGIGPQDFVTATYFDSHFAVCSHHIDAIAVGHSSLLPRKMETFHISGIRQLYGKMVENITFFLRPPRLPAATSVCFLGRDITHYPRHHIQAMHRLLDNEIARHPIVIKPIAYLELEVRPARLAGLQTEVASIPER